MVRGEGGGRGVEVGGGGERERCSDWGGWMEGE